MRQRRSFARSLDALGEIFDFSAAAFESEDIDASLLPTIDLVLEELFTNAVKYGGGESCVGIEIAAIAAGVEVVVLDHDANPFDLTLQPAVDTTQAIDARKPGGLGLHLIRKMVDSVEYRHSDAERSGRTTVRKTVKGPSAPE